MAEKVTRKKARRSVPAGQLHIQATFNNTIVTFTDKKGNVLTSKKVQHTLRRLLAKKQLNLHKLFMA